MNDPRLRDVILLRERIEEHNAYPFTVPVLRGFDRLTFERRLTFFVGENGSGKSILLEAIAEAAGFGPEVGSRNFSPGTTESAQATSALAKSPGRTFRRSRSPAAS